MHSERRFWRADLEVFGGWRCLLTEPSLWAVLNYRFGRWTLRHRPVLPVYLAWYWIVRLVTGIDIPRGAQIGPGLRVFHFGGIVVNPGTVIGARCRLRQGVTTGVAKAGGACPVIGDDVLIGPYAQILGGIRIGDGAKIGALAVVVDDVPAGATVVAPKAQILNKVI